MNASAVAISRAHSAWLRPSEPRRGRFVCEMCGDDARHTVFYTVEHAVLCSECTEDRTYSYDVFPEMEDERRRCCVCGCLCEGCVTVIDGRNYCADCVEEGREDE